MECHMTVVSEGEEAARSVLDGIVGRLEAWARRTATRTCAAVAPADAAACEEAGSSSGGGGGSTQQNLSYNPPIVHNLYESAPPVLQRGSSEVRRMLGPLLTAGGRDDEEEDASLLQAWLAPEELGHDYTHALPQILSSVAVALGGGASSNVLVRQVRCAKQHQNGRCGHHALHNALSASKAVRASTREGALAELANTQSEPAFWSRYFRDQQLLEEESSRRGGASWPWSPQAFGAGEVERSHMSGECGRFNT
jgi:hypothetical protein